MMDNYYYGHMFGLGGGIFMVIFWIALVLFIIWVIQSLSGYGNAGQADSALATLKQRYAKGEINKEEFETKKKELTN